LDLERDAFIASFATVDVVIAACRSHITIGADIALCINTLATHRAVVGLQRVALACSTLPTSPITRWACLARWLALIVLVHSGRTVDASRD
jgi:hypothetical protein